MRRGGTEVTAERLQNTIGLRCEGTTPERGRDAGETVRERRRGRDFPAALPPLQDPALCCRSVLHLTNTFTHFLLPEPGLRGGWSLSTHNCCPSATGPNTPIYPGTPAPCQNHTQTYIHRHTHMLVKSHAQLCTGSLLQGNTLLHVYTHTPSYKLDEPRGTTCAYIQWHIVTCMHTVVCIHGLNIQTHCYSNVNAGVHSQ